MQLQPRAVARPPTLTAVPSARQALGPEPDDRRYALMIAGAVVIGFVIRAMFVFSSSFPLNDGGMFYAMVRDLQGNGYAIPSFTSYNGGHIPFAYPPLGFYLAALLDDATPLSLVQVFRLLPLALSTLTIGAFFLLARDMIRSRIVVATAVLFFALLPPAFTWMIMGGGLTRALGFVFALLTVREVRRIYVEGSRWRIASASVLAALTVMSHIEMGWFACIIAGLFYVSYGRSGRAALQSLAVALAVVALTAPWWLTVVSYHGISPLIAAAHSTASTWWSPIALLAKFDVTGEPLFALLGACALLGIAVSLARRDYVFPAWVAAAAFLDQRAFLTTSAAGVAILAAIGVHEVVLPLVTRPRIVSPTSDDGDTAGAHRLTRVPSWLAPAALIVLVAYPVLGAMTSSPGVLIGLTPAERSAIAWAGANTDPSSRFIFVSGRAWPVDRTAEWFPALAHRQSVITPQGYEWLPGNAFDVQRSQFFDLQQCANGDGNCIAAWAVGSGKQFDYVYVETVPPAEQEDLGISTDKTCCDGLRSALRTDPRFRLVFDGPGATIFQRLPAG